MSVFEDSPFSSFSQIKNAVNNRSASLSFLRGPAYRIASLGKPARVLFTLIIPLVSSILLYVLCHLLGLSNWFILLGLLTLPAYIYVPRLRRLLLLIACACALLYFILSKTMPWILIISTLIMGLLIGYEIWWGIIYHLACKALLNNEALFTDAWEHHAVAIKMNGILYYHNITL